MPQVLELSFLPEQSEDERVILSAIKSQLGLTWTGTFVVLKRSIDSRKRQVKVLLRIAAYGPGEGIPDAVIKRNFQLLQDQGAENVIIVGAGPAGLFAALRLIECGVKPIILERGKDVQARRRDLAAIHKNHIVDPDSNYCFGEGGAGTYSDGKLFTRSTKRGNVRGILETLVQFGASEKILSDAHPHIGTNKLPAIISAIRQQIIDCGGEVVFNARVCGFDTENTADKPMIKAVRFVDTTTGREITLATRKVILATGHSARDIFEILHSLEVKIEFKPFALGVRIEHPQQLIDSIQYHCPERGEHLPPASYSLVEQVLGKGVYSFCMCPGGIIAPCATNPGEIVTNGWSPSKRNNPFANSGIVVPIAWEDIPEFHDHGPLAGMYFQQSVEQKCQQASGESQVAPAQRMVDFVLGRLSADLPECSYQPGVVSRNLNEILPPFVADALREGLKAFGKKMNGYFTNEAIVVAPESRTSSPVRIPRDPDTLEHPDLLGLFPCGEGAGYAGGIVSAAIDGELVANSIAGKEVFL